MANYLPVLLVSVSTNAVPDDSALTTLPTAQVDYLSHDWQEEDVWRSWRNMTRQKNEIANGMRLENASWRTWWKQRNKLKTVTPETLNWLKDSDVTWLYGPLHTAAEWTPPPLRTGSAHHRLDLSTSVNPHKPILKHRSISDLLTSDLPPTSPIFSPAESEDDASQQIPQRPSLAHTKSDTHITRWGPNKRAFRKDSPPRIDPPGFSETLPPAIRASHSQDSNSSAGGSGTEKQPKKKHISFNTFVEQCIAIEKPKKNASGFFATIDEGPWMGHGTVIDDDGYEEDQEDSEEADEGPFNVPWSRERPASCVVRQDSDEELQEDEEDDDGGIEMRSSVTYHNTPRKKPSPRSQSKVSTASSSSSTSTSTTNSSASTSLHTDSTSSPNSSLSPSRKPDRNPHRKPSSASSTTSTATARRLSNSTYRPHYTSTRRGPPPPLIRTPSEHVHVTIAPIAPTILKTGTGGWVEGFGDDGASDDNFSGWLNSIAGGGHFEKKRSNSFGLGRGPRRADDDAQGSSDGTPVELVYVPPFGSNYSLGTGEYQDTEYMGYENDHYQDEEEEEEGDTSTAADVYRHPITTGSVGFDAPATPSIPILSRRASSPSIGSQKMNGIDAGKFSTQRPDVREEDPYDFFGGPDMGEDYFYARRGGRGYERGATYGASLQHQPMPNAREMERQRERKAVGNGEERPSRSRSRSQSRTPSPALTSAIATSAGADDSTTERGRKRSSSSSISPSSPHITTSRNVSNLLSPPLPSLPRGRSYQEILPSSAASPPRNLSDPTPPTPRSSAAINGVTRGRSSTRTSSSSSWERGASVGSSPMGSLSPDGGAVGIGSVLNSAGTRGVRDRGSTGGCSDRERERGRDRGRGRERTAPAAAGNKVAVVAESVPSVVASPPPGLTIPQAVPMDSSFVSTSSTSSNNTILASQQPSQQQLSELEFLRRAEEEHRRRVHPTPSNSPVVEMRRVVPSSETGDSDDTFGTTPSGSASLSGSGGTTTPTASSLGSAGGGGSSMPPMQQIPSVLAQKSPASPPATSTTHARSPSVSSTSGVSTSIVSNPASPSRARPPPLITTPSLPVKPSTSFMAVSSPVSPSRLTASIIGVAPVELGEKEGSGTVLGKAVDMVSSAGAYLGLWQHSTGSG